MADDNGRPSTNQPLNGPRRPLAPALLAVLAMIIVVFVVFGLITWLRYDT
jgi:hypothetical protein